MIILEVFHKNGASFLYGIFKSSKEALEYGFDLKVNDKQVKSYKARPGFLVSSEI